MTLVHRVGVHLPVYIYAEFVGVATSPSLMSISRRSRSREWRFGWLGR